MQITQAELDRYRLQLARQQSDAKAYVIARLESEPGIADMPVADVRDRTIEIMKDCLGVYGDQAQALSAELFDEISEAEGLGASPAQIFDGLIDDSMMEEKVRYYARAIAGDEPDWKGYEGSNADLASYYVHRSAMQNMARNCDRNNVRYARVATGRDSCGFCFMLSSRGFDYRSSETATAASHPHCDCIIVPGKKGKTHIEGYEPGSMRERWAECYRAIGGRDQLSQDWDSLTKKEKAAYKGKTEAVRRDDYIRKRIQAECQKNDPLWLYRGVKLKDRGKYYNPMAAEEAADYVKTHTQSKKVNIKQRRHANPDDGRSVVTMSESDIEKAVKRLAGTGTMYVNNQPDGTVQIKEVLDLGDGNVVGRLRKGPEDPGTATTRLTVHYSDSGIHVVPAKP